MLDALDKSEHIDNTIIVFWSDHGWHLGEKNHWHKMTLWEEATRVPFYFCGPGVAKAKKCGRAVSLIDIYPTLIDLCGLDEKNGLDGRSLQPLLRDPAIEWNYPAIIEYKRGQCAVRDKRWRYIRYSNGDEELYDHSKDPREWENLANNKKYGKVKAGLAKWVTKDWSQGVPSKGAFKFDYKEYTWEHKNTGTKIDGM